MTPGQLRAKKIKEKHGDDFFKNIGRAGGSVQTPKGFAVRKDLAIAGGKKSRRDK